MSKYEAKYVSGVNIQAISSSTTTAGTAIDTKGYTEATVVLRLGARTDGTATLLIQESDDNSTFTDVADTFLKGTEAGEAVSTAHGFGVLGVMLRKRYLKVSIVSTSVTSGFTAGATVELCGAKHEPSADV